MSRRRYESCFFSPDYAGGWTKEKKRKIELPPSAILQMVHERNSQANLTADMLYHGIWAKLNNQNEIAEIRLSRTDEELRESDSLKDDYVIDFTDSSSAGLNESTLLVLAASLQGTRRGIRREIFRRTEQRPNPDLFPAAYSNPKDGGLYRQIQAWINRTGVIIRSLGNEWSPERIRFYTVLRDLLNLGDEDFKTGDRRSIKDAYTPLVYCLTEAEFSNERCNHFGIFRAFFPNIDQLLKQKIERKIGGTKISASIAQLILVQASKKEISFSELMKEMVKMFKQLGLINDNLSKELLTEMTILMSEKNVSLEEILKDIDYAYAIDENDQRTPQKKITELTRTRGNFNIEESFSNGEPTEVIRLPSLAEFGLRVDRKKTALLKQLEFGMTIEVVDIKSIRENPEGYYLYQRALVKSIATNLAIHKKIDLDINHHIPFPPYVFKGPNNEAIERNKAVFREHEKLLKHKSDWLWYMLYPEVQNLFIQLLPFVQVPPYLDDGNRYLPVWDPRNKVKINRLLNEGRKVVNELPFLNRFDPNRLSEKLTIIGEFVKGILTTGGFAYIDHGAARRVVAGFSPLTNEDSEAYVVNNIYPPFDVDMLLFGNPLKTDLSVSIASIAQNVTSVLNMQNNGKRYDLSSSDIKGQSMTGVDYTYIAKYIAGQHGQSSISRDPYKTVHHPACIFHGLRAWQGRNTESKSNILVESLLALSRFRSFGLVPILLKTSDKKNEVIAAKLVDLFGGLPLYAEMGKSSGISVQGRKWNVIDFFSYTDAFPPNLLDWHLWRTIHDLTGGVFYPSDIDTDLRIINSDNSGLTRIGIAELAVLVDQVEKKIGYFKTVAQNPTRYATELLQIEDHRSEWKKGAARSLEADPLGFITLMMEKDYFDESRGIGGIELNRLLYHWKILAENGLLKSLIKRLYTYHQKEGESNTAFVTRMLLMDGKTRAVIAKAIRNEFINSPIGIGKKLNLHLYPDQRNLNLPSDLIDQKEKKSWGMLDPYVIGPYIWADHSHSWGRFISGLSKRGAFPNSWEEMEEIIRTEKHLYNKKYVDEYPTALAQIKTMIEQGDPIMVKLQTEAMADWLSEPDF